MDMDGTEKSSVLIVDDSIESIMMLTFILKYDYIIYKATSGKEALDSVMRNKPDIILLDVLMPKMDGYDVLLALKKNDETKDIPVIFVTGLTEASDEEKGLSMGASDYITKPFSDAIVKLRVEKQLKLGKLEQKYNEAMAELASLGKIV